MRKLLLGSALLAAMAVAQAALARDIEPVVVPDPWTAPPAFSVRRVYNWTGVYVGLQGGGTWGRSDWASVPDVTSGTYSASGALFGGTLGYNLQADGPLVLGVEADIAGSSVKGTVPPATCAPNCEITSPWLATARVRFGYAFNDVQPYVTAGAAIGRLTASIVGQPFGSERANNLGWVAGFGVEFVLAGPWTAKLEYLHADLGGITCNVACNGPVSINLHENIIRAGVNYRIWRN